MTKLYVDEIQKTGRVNKPIQVANVGFNISYGSATVTNFASSSEVTLDISLANYFILKLDDCTNDVKDIKLINTQNSSFNSFVLDTPSSFWYLQIHTMGSNSTVQMG